MGPEAPRAGEVVGEEEREETLPQHKDMEEVEGVEEEVGVAFAQS